MNDIYEVLKADHDEQRRLLAVVGDTEGASDDRAEAFAQLRRELDAHADAEEQTLYAELIGVPTAQERARHSIVEHAKAADLLEELADKDQSSSGWIQTFRKLAESVGHHLEEEEEKVFPQAREFLSAEQAQELADTFRQRKQAEQA